MRRKIIQREGVIREMHRVHNGCGIVKRKCKEIGSFIETDFVCQIKWTEPYPEDYSEPLNDK